MSKIYLTSQEPHHFLMDSKGDLYEVSEEIAQRHSEPTCVMVVDHVDADTNTIYFSSPSSEKAAAE